MAYHVGSHEIEKIGRQVLGMRRLSTRVVRRRCRFALALLERVSIDVIDYGHDIVGSNVAIATDIDIGTASAAIFSYLFGFASINVVDNRNNDFGNTIGVERSSDLRCGTNLVGVFARRPRR